MMTKKELRRMQILELENAELRKTIDRNFSQYAGDLHDRVMLTIALNEIRKIVDEAEEELKLTRARKNEPQT